jgi:hypothetical protein
MNFCRLPPDRLLAGPGPPGLDVEAGDQSSRQARRRGRCAIQPARDTVSVRREQVFCARLSGHGAAAQALFGHEVQALAAVARRHGRRWLAEQL